MDTTKPHGFFLASFLLLVFLGDLTEACRPCPEISLREVCCREDFVLRVKFMGVGHQPYASLPPEVKIFAIRPLQVYKGPRYLGDSRFLYTRPSQDYCEYQHRGPLKGEQYLISGSVIDRAMQIHSCNLVIPWEETSLADKMNLDGVGGRSCRSICG